MAAVSGAQADGAGHAHGATGGDKPAGGSGGDKAPKVGETKPPKDQPSAGASNVGARPSAGGSEGASQARAGAHTEGAHGADGGHSSQVPERTPNLEQGSTGPIVPEGQARTITIPDGPGFGGEKGREQNGDDKKQNNYSVTDANFNPALGLMSKDPDTGKDMTYVQHIQTYNAAGYIKTFAPDTAKRLQQAQDDGVGMFLEGSAYLMGLTKTEPSYLSAYGITGSDIPSKVPGTNRDAREYVADGQDATGQDWARMHHPKSAWDMYKGLLDIGVNGEQALRLAGDDGVSGAGRLNGQNNQDGGNGFNAGEVEVWKEAAALQQRTGLPIIQTMMAGHDHNHLDASALTNPEVNERLGITGRDASPERANAIYQGLLNGQLDEPENNGGGGGGGNDGGGAEGAGGAGGGGGDEVQGGGEAEEVTEDATLAPVDTEALKAALLGGPAPADEAGLVALLQQALAYLQQVAPEVYAQLMGAQAQGGIDAALAAGMALGLFDNPAYAALVPPQELAATEQALAQLQIGRAGVDPRIVPLVPVTTTPGVAPGAAAPGAAPLADAGAGVAALGGAPAAAPTAAAPVATPTPAAAAPAPAGATDGHAHAH